MSSRRRSAAAEIAAIIVLLILIIFLPRYGWAIRQWLSPQTPAAVGQGASPETAALAAENQTLEAQLATYAAIASELPTSTLGQVRAMVYSRYPLNFKNELLVNAGTDRGIATGSAVLFQGIFIGQVTQAFKDFSLVQTIFDSGLKLPVRVGTSGTDGLLEGGPYPVVGSLAKSAPVATGDIVYSAAPGLPYGLPIGTVAATSTSADNLFTQATINFAYDVNDIQTVLIEP